MSIFNDKALKGVAEAAAKIMAETSHNQLKGNQHKIDANKNGKIDSHDFKLLRAKKSMNKEEVEQLDEVGDTPAGRKALSSYVSKALGDKNREKGLRKATSRLYKDNYYGKKTNEEVEEQIDEAFPSVEDAKKRMAAGKTATGTVTKTATGLVHKRDYEDGKDDDDTPKKKGGYGARQNYKRSTRVNEQLSFTEMLELYNEHGLKVLAPIETEEMDIDGTTIEVIDGDKINGYVETTIEEGLGDAVRGAVGVVKDVISKEKAYQAQKQKKAGEVLSKMRREEVTNDEFTKEFEDQKASFEGKKKQPKVAAGRTMGVKTMPEEVELDEEQLDERAKWRTSSIAHDTGYRKDGPHGGIENTADTGKEDLLRSRQMLSRYGTPKKSEVKSLKKSITKNIAQMKKEEVEQLEELKKSTLGSYVKKAALNYGSNENSEGAAGPTRTGSRISANRERGIEKAADRLSGAKKGYKMKEEVELDERTLTKGEAEKKEDYVKGMKKKLSGFKERYGERAKEVMYATATKMAKKD